MLEVAGLSERVRGTSSKELLWRRRMWNVQAGLLSVSVINAVYNLIAEFVGKVRALACL